MAPLIRTRTAHHPTLTQWSSARSTSWSTPPDGKSVLEIQTTHTPTVFAAVPDAENILIPPFHWHWHQTEYFHVRQGRYLFTLEDRTFAVSAADPQPVRIPATARHTFRVDPSWTDGECVIEISTETSPGQDRREEEEGGDTVGASERFFRNIYSYLEDCHVQKGPPSLPQLLLMLHDAEISLAFPGPAKLMQWVSWGFGLVGGKVIGQYLLGYRSSYPEYYDPMRRSREEAAANGQQQNVLREDKKGR